MSTTLATASSLAETVKEETKSPSTVTPRTLKLLRALLGLDEPTGPVPSSTSTVRRDGNGSAKPTTKASATPSSHRAKPIKSRAPSNLVIFTSPETFSPLSTDAQKLKLATETFNSTLKCLSNATRSKNATGMVVKDAPDPTAAPPKVDRSNSCRPMQETSPNRGSKHQPLQKLTPKPPIQPGLPEAGLVTTAECARTALECLRELEKTDKKTQDLQLEQGSLILLGNLNSLNLPNLAFQEICALRKRLDLKIRGCKEISTSVKNLSSLPSGKPSDVALTVLRFDTVPVCIDLYSLVISFQKQVLRTIAAWGPGAVSQSLVDTLGLGCKYGPYAIILESHKRNLLPTEKVAHHLQALAQTVSLLYSFTQPAPGQATGRALPPEMTLQLQLAALQIHCRSSTLTGAQVSLEQILWAPFVRIVDRFCQRSKASKREQYDRVMHELQLLRSAFEPTPTGSSSYEETQTPPAVSECLAKLAQDCGCHANSLDHLQRFLQASNDPQSLSSAVCYCKISVLRLQAVSDNSKSALSAGEEALASLKGPLKGSAQELESMLLHGVRLRKVAFDTLWKLEKSSEFALPVNIQMELRSCLIRIIFAFLNFVTRYIGRPPPCSSIAQEDNERFDRKLRLAWSITETTISNALTAARSAVDNAACAWVEVDSALTECHALGKILDASRAQTAVPEESRTTPSTFIKISNTYWSQFLRRKDASSEPSELLTLLKSSIRVLEDRSEPERQAGFLAAKFEKLASVYMGIQRLDKASQALRDAIAIHASSRAFQEVIRTDSSQSLRCSWENDASPIFAFGKTLAAYVRLCASLSEPKQEHPYFYDDETLSKTERIALLERQSIIHMNLASAVSAPAPIAALARSTLALYSQPHILRRVQFLLSILKYLSIHRNDYLEDLLEEALTESKLCDLEHEFRSQPSLSPCGLALFASLRLQWAFKQGRPSTQLLRDMISEWSLLTLDNEDWPKLENQLQDPSFLLGQIQAVIDYTDMQGLSKLRLGAFHLQQTVIESQHRKDHIALALSLVHKGQQYNRLGDTVNAGKALACAKNCIDAVEFRPALSLQYHLAHAEYLLNISSWEGFEQALEAARAHYAAAFNVETADAVQHLSSSQTKFLCQAAFLNSRSELERGNLNGAVFHAKHSVKLSSQIWAGMQRTLGHNRMRKHQGSNESTLDSIVEEFSSISISNNATNERSASSGAAFWRYVSTHCEALLHLSGLLAHCGLYQDAVYYADQAQHVAQAVDSPFYVFMASTLLLAHLRKGKDANIGQETMCMRRPPLDADHASISIISTCVYLAEASVSAGEFTAASEAIEEATQRLSMIGPGLTTASATAESDESKLAVRISTRPKSKSRARAVSKSTQIAAKAHSARPRRKERQSPVLETVAQEEPIPLVTFMKFRTTLNVLKAHIMASSGEGQDAMSLLAGCKDVSSFRPDFVRRRLIEARTILDEFFESVSADAVHCVLAETTIAFPSLQKKDQALGKKVLLQPPVATKTSGKGRKLGVANCRKTAHDDTGSDLPSDLVMRAAELLLEAMKPPLGSCPINMLRELSLMLNQCFMLSSVIPRQRNYTPWQVALQAATPICLAMARESSVIETDVTLSNKSTISSWPESVYGDRTTNQLSSMDAPSIDIGFLDKLPAEWSIVSMQLGKARDELSVTKLHVGQSPFSLRIPLRRSSSDEPDEEDFGFAAAKVELLDIIETANKTAHDSRGQSDKQAKKSWWAEREALDERLRILLENIENVWLGGFRGILAHQPRQQDLLSRFSGSLDRSLDQHLPSRQKSRRTTGTESHLHAHVLDLFVALGHPDNRDLSDSIADLLYFVVDILQFQGEQNAYDEIDFDMITVEVLDALRCYHEARQGLDEEPTQHTILILDKELLAFPWESLPCLEGRPVSRMPSLSCVETRLNKMRLQKADTSTLSISASNGAYILNPSSDLRSTQSTFAGPFSISLPTFSSIVDRAPTESEFESFLCEKELFLYFGHGSGAQYIRGRNIKRLKQCAVTFLMGCSSGRMVECGAFEPYGVPWNYMHASAPAVVGTLWDVTDKDIDRFAMKSFTEWGLLEREHIKEEAAGGKKKGKNAAATGKSRKQPSHSARERDLSKRKVALDEAVARARSSCVLRYLNGAAPVIYGIPVVLA
jgi:separase